MDRKIIAIAVLLVLVSIMGMAYLVFPLNAASGDEQTRVDDIEIRSVENGKAVEVIFTGEGFGHDPRVSLSLDVANQKSIVGTLRTWGALQDVAVAGDLAVLANGSRGVQVVDISDATRPNVVGSVEVSGKAMAVTVRGGMAFVACARGGVSVVDFSVPRHPFVVGKLFLPDVAWDLEIVGEFLYVAAGRSGLHVVEVANPVVLHRVASLPLGGHSVCVKSIGSGRLMVASVQSGVQIVDISEPTRPALVCDVDPAASTLSVAAGEGLGFAAELAGHLTILDLQADKENPPILGSMELLGQPAAMTYRDGRLYVAAHSGWLHVADVSVPTAPRLVGTVGMRNARGVTVENGHIFVANSKGGLVVVEESAIQPLQVVDFFNSEGNARNLNLVDRTLYLPDGLSGLKVLDVDEQGRLRQIGQVPLKGKTRDVEVAGGYAYVADYEGGLDVIDMARPEEPRLVGSVETMGLAMALRFHDGVALVVTSKVTGKVGEGMVNGVQFFDLSDPVRPQLLSSLPLDEGSGIGVAIDTDTQTAFLVAGSGGVIAVDIADSRNPRIVGRFVLPWPEYVFSPAIGAAFREGILYVANGRNGLLALDVTDRTNPTLIAVMPTQASALGVSLKGNRAYLSLGEKGVAVVDISNPKQLRMMARMDLPLFARQFVVQDGRAIFGNGYRGVFVVPLPVEGEVLSSSPTRVICRFPIPETPGDYTLSIFGLESFAEVRGALSLPLH